MLEKDGLFLKDTIKEHKWLIAQRKHVSTKFDAIKEHYELLGLHTKDKPDSAINIGLFVEH